MWLAWKIGLEDLEWEEEQGVEEEEDRVAQTFIHEKFVWDQTDFGFLGSKHYKNTKILKFGQYLDIAKCDQSFTT